MTPTFVKPSLILNFRFYHLFFQSHQPKMTGQGPRGVSGQPFNRACDACRSHKVRCLPNGSEPSKICQRCARTDRKCVYTAPQKRKQRKRTDTRVAELEREVQAMRSLFERKNEGIEGSLAENGQQPGTSGTPSMNGTGMFTADVTGSVVPGESPDQESPASISTPSGVQDRSHLTYSPDSDVVDRGILSMDEADQLFQSYNNDLTQHYPTVVFPNGCSVEDLRRKKPTLFLSVIAAAAGKVDPHLYSILNTEVLSSYAYRTVTHSEKSLELVQAMIITSIWYYPPGNFAQLKFYEYIHMAATMALDIGLGTNPKSSRSRRGTEVATPTTEKGHVNEVDLEKRRTFLVCYLITTGYVIILFLSRSRLKVTGFR